MLGVGIVSLTNLPNSACAVSLFWRATIALPPASTCMRLLIGFGENHLEVLQRDVSQVAIVHYGLGSLRQEALPQLPEQGVLLRGWDHQLQNEGGSQ